MKEYLRPLKNRDFDGINFYRNENGDFEVSAFNYKTPGTKLEGSSLGELYDIIIFNEESPKMPERFQAVLISPLDYISRIIDDGFLGVVAKATTNSDNFMTDAFNHMSKRVEEYIEKYGENDAE